MVDVAGQRRGDNPGYSERPGPSRRRFLDYLLGTSAIATLSAFVYPIFKFMSPPQVIESTENSVVAAKLNEVPRNSKWESGQREDSKVPLGTESL